MGLCAECRGTSEWRNANLSNATLVLPLDVTTPREFLLPGSTESGQILFSHYYNRLVDGDWNPQPSDQVLSDSVLSVAIMHNGGR